MAGTVALIVGVIRHGGPALIGGVVLCLLGVTEVTAREHLSGYRSHTVLLAAIPAVVAEFLIVLTVGTPAVRVVLLVPVAAVFGGLRLVPAPALPGRAPGAAGPAAQALTAVGAGG